MRDILQSRDRQGAVIGIFSQTREQAVVKPPLSTLARESGCGSFLTLAVEVSKEQFEVASDRPGVGMIRAY
jgi:hypothetical protein